MRSLSNKGLASPDRYHFAFEGDDALFLPMDRAAYQRSIFMDGRISPASTVMQRMPVSQLSAVALTRPARTGWIFHVAHCGSTLLARAIDLNDRSLIIREPLPFRQLGVDRAKVCGELSVQKWHDRLALACSLVGRRYDQSIPVIVKANVPVNFIITDVMALDREAPVVLLYFPLNAYLSAVLRSPNHRNWVLNVTSELNFAIAGEIGEIADLDDVQRAAALWLSQMRIYTNALATYPNIVSLCAEDLFNMPTLAISATTTHFGISMEADEIDALVQSEIFSTYSKNPTMAFDNAIRLSRQAEIERTLTRDLIHARKWIDRQLATFPLPARLDRPLIGAPPLLSS